MEKILISSCLLGINTKYNGENNYNALVEKLKLKYELIPICPEVLGGLSIPRLPSEIRKDRVVNKDLKDVTIEFTIGAEKVLKIAKEENIKIAILKNGSPSCGVSYIYDGTFSNIKIAGAGITTKLLIKNNIKIYSEEEIEKLL